MGPITSMGVMRVIDHSRTRTGTPARDTFGGVVDSRSKWILKVREHHDRDVDSSEREKHVHSWSSRHDFEVTRLLAGLYEKEVKSVVFVRTGRARRDEQNSGEHASTRPSRNPSWHINKSIAFVARGTKLSHASEEYYFL